MNLRHLCTPVDFKCLLMRECRPAPTESEHVSKCATSDAREPHLQLLGGFAGRIGLKRRNTPAFPQVGGANGEQPPPKTAQKSKTMAKSAPISCKPPEVGGGRDRGQGRGSRRRRRGRNPRYREKRTSVVTHNSLRTLKAERVQKREKTWRVPSA